MGNAKSTEKKGIGALNWTLLLASGQLVRKFSLMFKKSQCMQKFIHIQWTVT